MHKNKLIMLQKSAFRRKSGHAYKLQFIVNLVLYI